MLRSIAPITALFLFVAAGFANGGQFQSQILAPPPGHRPRTGGRVGSAARVVGGPRVQVAARGSGARIGFVPQIAIVAVPRPVPNACAPLAIPHAVYEPVAAGDNSINSGGRVSVKCMEGYGNQGAEWLVCEKGNWIVAAWSTTRQVPACHASCSTPLISNATFTPELTEDSLSGHGSRITVSCEDGYEFVGSNIIECYHGEWTNLDTARCMSANESFCRDEAMTPVVSGIITQYGDDPMRTNEVLNYYFLNIKGVIANGLGYIGLNPTAAYKSYDSNAYYVPGATGSDAVYRALVVPGNWNVTETPAHLSGQNTVCRIYDEDKELTAYVFKVLYKPTWGRYVFNG